MVHGRERLTDVDTGPMATSNTLTTAEFTVIVARSLRDLDRRHPVFLLPPVGSVAPSPCVSNRPR